MASSIQGGPQRPREGKESPRGGGARIAAGVESRRMAPAQKLALMPKFHIDPYTVYCCTRPGTLE